MGVRCRRVLSGYVEGRGREEEGRKKGRRGHDFYEAKRSL